MKNQDALLTVPDEPARAKPGFSSQLLAHLKTSLVVTIVLAMIVCGVYPLLVWGLSQAIFHNQANGSLIGRDGRPVASEADAVGSSLIGQSFAASQYFHPRPSAAGNGYDPTASGGSNLGPTSAKLMNGTLRKDDKGNKVVDYDGVRDRIVHYCAENAIGYDASAPLAAFEDKDGNLDDVKLIEAFNADTSPLVFTPRVRIPADAVTASGSGLDPHISPANAMLQAARIAERRHVSLDAVRALIDQNTDSPSFGILGDAGVNVLKLNLALDREAPMPTAVAPRGNR